MHSCIVLTNFLPRRLGFPDYQATKNTTDNYITLLRILAEINNGTSTVTHYVYRIMKGMYNLLYLNGSEYDLHTYMMIMFNEREKSVRNFGIFSASKSHKTAILIEITTILNKPDVGDNSTWSCEYQVHEEIRVSIRGIANQDGKQLECR